MELFGNPEKQIQSTSSFILYNIYNLLEPFRHGKALGGGGLLHLIILFVLCILFSVRGNGGKVQVFN